ncbi:MAG: hypothetical protein MJK13_12245, partial [Pseudomonadales bacterium]|nr:hypothetical protein [Pseudomonadales bacterium]
MKNTILQVVQHLRPGGIETMALELMKQLSRDHTVHLVSLEGNYQEAVSAWPRLACSPKKRHLWLSFPHFLAPKNALRGFGGIPPPPTFKNLQNREGEHPPPSKRLNTPFLVLFAQPFFPFQHR